MNVTCPECGFVAKRECGLGSHRYWKHGVLGKTYPPVRCPTCGDKDWRTANPPYSKLTCPDCRPNAAVAQ